MDKRKAKVEEYVLYAIGGGHRYDCTLGDIASRIPHAILWDEIERAVRRLQRRGKIKYTPINRGGRGWEIVQ